MRILEAKNLSKKQGEALLFENVSFSFPFRGLVLLLGESGSGKTSLFELLSGIDPSYEGELRFKGREWKRLEEGERSEIRRTSIGLLRQEFDLLSHETSLDNVLFPLGKEGRRRVNKIRAKALLSSLGLKGKEKERAYRLSGGEKARLSFARALITDPSLLLCDEPTGALDLDSAKQILSILKEASKDRLVLVSTHDETFFKGDADAIYRIKNKEIQCEKPLKLRDSSSGIKNEITAQKAAQSPLFWLRHAFSLLKARRLRSALSVSLLFLGYFSLGLSVFFSRNVEDKMSRAFRSLLGEGVITMRRREGDLEGVHNVFSAPKKDVLSLMGNLPKESYLLASYLSPFERLFPDENSFFFSLGARRHYLPSMSARSINDFLLPSDIDGLTYPSLPMTLEVDEVVLGLPEDMMRSLAGSLRVEKDYRSVGESLLRGEALLELETSNLSWSYYDRQSLRVKGVSQSKVPTLYHPDPLWNERFYEERMGFPSSDGSSFENPWTLQKVYGIGGIDEESFLRKTREESFSNYLFERDSSLYDQSHEGSKEERKGLRYFAYLADKNGLSYADLEKVSSLSSISSISYLPESVYRSFPESLSSGFVEPFLLGLNQDSILPYGESLSRVKEEFRASFLELPKDVALGSYLRPRGNSLLFRSDYPSLLSGRKPEKIDEIVLSKSLYEKLRGPKKISIGAVAESYLQEGYLKRRFSYHDLKVTGVHEGDYDEIHQDPYWLRDFFQARVGISARYLEAREAHIHLREEGTERKVVELLEGAFPNHRFLDPSKAISESLEDVFGYLRTLLSFLSLILILSSFYLIYVLSSLYAKENEREGRSLYLLGFKRRDILESYGAGIFLMSASAFLSASFSLFFTMYVFDEALSELFAMPFVFSFDPLPHLSLFVAFLLASLFAFLSARGFALKTAFWRRIPY